MHKNKNLIGSPHARKLPAKSSSYRPQLVAFVRMLVSEVDNLDIESGDEKTLVILHGLCAELWPVLDHEFPHGFGLGQAIEEWIELKRDPNNKQMANHQRKIVVEDLDKFLGTTPEQFHRKLNKSD